MRTITKIRRSTRGLSPIFATLILIAIAVIAGIIVYMFTSGTLATMLGGGTAGQEKIAIQAVSGTGSTILVYAQSTGGGPVAIDSAIIKTAAGTVHAAGTVTTGTSVGTTLAPITVTSGSALTPGDSYTVTLVSKAGGSFVSPSFKAT